MTVEAALAAPSDTAPAMAPVLLALSVVTEAAAGVEPPSIPSIAPTKAVDVMEVAADTVPRLAIVVLAKVEFC